MSTLILILAVIALAVVFHEMRRQTTMRNVSREMKRRLPMIISCANSKRHDSKYALTPVWAELVDSSSGFFVAFLA